MSESRPGMTAARDVVVSQAVALGVAVALTTSGVPARWAITAAVVVMIGLSLPRDGRPVVGHVSTWLRLLARRPVPARTVLSFDRPGGPIGVVWNGSDLTIVAELVVEPAASGWSTVGSRGATPDAVVPLRDLVDRLSQCTDAPTHLGVSSIGTRPVRGRRAADAYLSMAGPLASVARRRTFLSLSTDVHEGAPAAARRGGAAAGSVQMLATTMARLQHVMRTHRLVGNLLTADQIRAADLLVTSGAPLRHVRPQWRFARLGGSTWRTRSLPPSAWNAAAVDSIGDHDADVTSLAVRATLSTTTTAATATYGYLSADVPQRRSIRVAGSRTLDGLHRHGLEDILVSSARPATPTHPVEAAQWGTLALPVAGYGQVVGVDSDGTTVTARLFGRDVHTVDVHGELYVVHQIVFRSVAVGAVVLVMTDRPHAWRHLAVAVADSGTLSVVTPVSDVESDTAVDLVVADHAGDRPTPVAGTVLRVNPASSTGATDIVIDQSSDVTDEVILTMASRSITLRLVTTAAETEAIGRPRGLSRPVSAVRVGLPGAL
ncbi:MULTISPECIES: type VII secretion protein EccE [Nocardiaceae]|uniref:Type VII secretion protein EccE n=1 Tax=Rhodococcoides corynebacterioides TaxID=53972 RepID=A0ABS2KQB9_9NOCA|nr:MULTISPECIES: type VII secretion protein EccE [Rhodococcus]MBM7414088.1 type VII secretion protein EccE [Rhodococcus corynebacterioides]MBP1116551.1 type VII secretion protein EccE [Rhodococcus sp. PvP016]